MNEPTPAGNGRTVADDDYQVKLSHAMRRALQRAANYAMRHDDLVAASNEALEILHAELLWRFEILGYRRRQNDVIVPEPMSPATERCEQHAINVSQ